MGGGYSPDIKLLSKLTQILIELLKHILKIAKTRTNYFLTLILLVFLQELIALSFSVL
jgi:hypothetical protein